MILPRILVIGPPAAGKSTIRSFIQAWFQQHNMVVPLIGIEEAHRRLLPPGHEDGTYRYTEAGALILLEPERQIPKALALMIGWCRKAAEHSGFVAELAHRDIPSTLAEFGDLLRNALVVYVTAPQSVRLARNAARVGWQVPERIVCEYPDLSLQDIEAIVQMGATIEIVETTATLAEIEECLRQILEQHIERKEAHDTRCTG